MALTQQGLLSVGSGRTCFAARLRVLKDIKKIYIIVSSYNVFQKILTFWEVDLSIKRVKFTLLAVRWSPFNSSCQYGLQTNSFYMQTFLKFHFFDLCQIIAKTLRQSVYSKNCLFVLRMVLREKWRQFMLKHQ